MGFRHVCNLMVGISVIVHAANLDFPWSSGDDLLFSDPGLPSSVDGVAFDQPDSLSDLSSSFLDGSDSPLENTDHSDLFSTDSVGLDDQYTKLADCSPPEASWIFGQSRIKRRDASNACTNPETGPLKAQGSASDAAGDPSQGLDLGAFSIRSAFTQQETKRKQNGVCTTITVGALPWGVCYLPTGVPLRPAGTTVVPPGSGTTMFPYYILDPATLASGSSDLCPSSDQAFYCCMEYFANNIPNANIAPDYPTLRMGPDPADDLPETTILPEFFQISGYGLVCVAVSTLRGH